MAVVVVDVVERIIRRLGGEEKRRERERRSRSRAHDKMGVGGSEVKCREESVERREEWSVASRRAGEENIRRVRSRNRTEQNS